MFRYIPGLLLLLFAASCQQSGTGSTDAQIHDGGADAFVLSLPVGCPPDAGNEIGIGKPCSKGGNECGSGLLCTCGNFAVTLPANMPCLCTNAIASASCPTNPNCGSNATCCAILGVVSGCIPNVCLVTTQQGSAQCLFQ
jgi:hypothetical protein